MSEDAEQSTPKKVLSTQGLKYFLQSLDSTLEGIYYVFGKSVEIHNEQADPRWGRSHLGATFEDSLLLWPPRPTNWLTYPKADNEHDFPNFSRDGFILRSEQKNYSIVDNLHFMAEQNAPQNKGPEDILAPKRFVESQKNYSKAYSKDININEPQVPSRVKERIMNVQNLKTIEQIQESLDPRKIFEEIMASTIPDIPTEDVNLITARMKVAIEDTVTFVVSAGAVTVLSSYPKFRPISSPMTGIIAGLITTTLLHTKWQSFHGLTGQSQLAWQNRVSYGWSHVYPKQVVEVQEEEAVAKEN